jgi:hypothetical protein
MRFGLSDILIQLHKCLVKVFSKIINTGCKRADIDN